MDDFCFDTHAVIKVAQCDNLAICSSENLFQRFKMKNLRQSSS